MSASDSTSEKLYEGKFLILHKQGKWGAPEIDECPVDTRPGARPAMDGRAEVGNRAKAAPWTAEVNRGS
ncbi:MAG TPA: hypothetical protein VHE37_15150 [Nevskiaceae bacterium]|nr:hypothetical protein [Nevskiaceae bacterium]